MGVPAMWLSVRAAQEIGGKLGEVIEVDPDSEGVRGLGFLRVRIAIEALAPLPRGLSIARGKDSLSVEFLYERLENYCFRCGFIDHVEDDCTRTYEEPLDPKNIRWTKVMSAIPPVKRAIRQDTSRVPSSAYFRSFGSVSPIGRAHGLSTAGSAFPPGNVNGRLGKTRKRSPPRITHPAHEVKDLPTVSGATLTELADKRIRSEQVGKDAHPTA